MASLDATRARIGSRSRPDGSRAGTDGGAPIGWAIPIVLLVTAVAFFVVYLIDSDIGNLQSAAAFAITAAPFLVAAREAPGRLVHPMAVFGFTMVLGIAGQTTYITHDSSLRGSLLSGLSMSILNRALLVVAVGVLVMCVGYLAVGPRRRTAPGRAFRWAMSRRIDDPSVRRVFWICLALLVISGLAFAVYAPKVGINSLGELLKSQKRFAVVEGKVLVYGYYRSLVGLCGVGFLLATYTIVRNRLKWRSGLGAVAVLSILGTAGFAIVTSSRTEFFDVAAIAIFIALGLRQREPRLAVIIGTVIAALAAVTLLIGLRSVSNGQSESLSHSTRIESIVENAAGSRDWMDIGPIAVVIDRVPDAYPYQYGKTLASILWAPVPRSVWKGKPAVRIGPATGPPIYGFLPSERVSGDPPGILGELWINGGLIAVIVGMFVLGIGIRWVERWYEMVDSTAGLSALLFGVGGIAICLQLPISDFTGVLTIVLENVAILAVLLWIARPRDRSRRRRTESIASTP
jgi:hypothetical protein